MMIDLRDKFSWFVRKHNLIHPKEKILMAVSGGMDSMTLMDLMVSVRSSWNLCLWAVHVQHGIRGRSAETDEAFVNETCLRWGIPFISLKTDAAAYSRVKKISLETGARELRYAFFQSILDRLSLDRLALGHQADDQAETILLNLVRGAGLKGLGGMLPIRGRIIRPLLFSTREEIEEYVRQKKIDFRTDETNRDIRFRRNRMRWNVLGNLKKNFGGHVSVSICRAGIAVSEAEAVIHHEANHLLGRMVSYPTSDVLPLSGTPDEIALDIHQFLNYFKGIQKSILIQIFQMFGPLQRLPSYHEIERILELVQTGRNGAAIQLGNGISVVKSDCRLVWKKARNGSKDIFAVEIGRKIEIVHTGFALSSETIEWKSNRRIPQNNTHQAYLDWDQLQPPFQVRFFRPGDWFIPLGMKGKKKLQDYFVDMKIPKDRRSEIPLFLSKGRIAWVCGCRMDERFKIRKQTKNALKLEISRI